MWEYILWGVIFVAALAVEAATMSLVSIWLAAAAVVTFFVAAAGGAFWLQCLIFVVLSLLLFLLTRPLTEKFRRKKPVRTNADSVIGMEGVVRREIEPLQGGRVCVGGLDWSARSSQSVPIPVGSCVVVEKIEGATLLVRPAEAPKEA